MRSRGDVASRDSAGSASSCANSVGTPQKIVGACVAQPRASRPRASAAPRISTAVAPTENGNVSELPRPYAKNSFAAENTTSSAVIPRIARA